MDQCPLLEVDHDPTKNGWDRENGNANKLYESYGSINKSNDESNGDGDGDGDGDAFLEKSCRSQHRSISSSITNDKVDDSDGDGIGRYRGSCGSLRSRNRNRRNSGSLRDRKSGTSTRSSSARDNTITANVDARDLFDKSNNVEQQQQLLDDEITGRIDTIAALLNPTALQRRDSFFPTTVAAAATAPPLLVNQTSVGDTDLSFTPLQHISASNTSTANNNATSYNVNIGRNNINDSNINEDNNNHIIANNGEANIAFQCALRLAANSYKYGCVGYRIEVFLVKLLEVYGYNCSVIVNNSELIASIFSYTKPVTNVRGHHRRRRRPRKNINDHTSNSNSISSNGNGNIHDTKPRNNNKHASSSSSSSSSDNDNDNDNNNNDDDDDLETTITGLTTTAAVLTANDGDEMDNFDDFFTVNSDDDNSDNDFDLEESHGHHRGRHHKGVDCDSNDNGIDDDDSTIMSFIMEEEHFLPITISIPLNYGEDLYKLGKLSDVCHNILFNSLSLQSAMIQLEEIEGLDPQWNTAARFAAYVGTSVGYAYILGGNWNDVLLSSIGSMITWFNIEMFSMYAPYDSIRRLHSTWQNFFSAFFPALLASVVNKMKWSEEDGNIDDNAININTVVISCIISELPGLGIKKGISELARSRVLAGLSHVFGAVFTSFWLGLGGWIAEGIVSSFDYSCLKCTMNRIINNSSVVSKALFNTSNNHTTDSSATMESIKTLRHHLSRGNMTNSITFGNITGGLISIHNDLVTSSSNDNITFTEDEFFVVDDNAPDPSLYDENSASDPNANISFDWIFLFAPLLCICFPIYFKVGHRETIPAFFVSLLSLSMTLIITEFNNAMLGSFVAAFVTSLASHVWSRGWHGCYCLTSRQWLRVENYNNKSSNQKKFRYKHKVDIHPPYRPESIVGIPAFFALAGGSLGFRGSFGLLDGDTTTGESQFQKMLVLTIILVLGVYVGETVLPSKAVLNAW